MDNKGASGDRNQIYEMNEENRTTAFENREKHQPDDFCLLLSTFDIVQVSLLQNMLAELHIPSLVKSQGLGTHPKVFLGRSFYPTNIYVNSSDFDRAKELLDSCFSELEGNRDDEIVENSDCAPTENDYEASEKEEIPSYRWRKIIVRIINALFLFVILAALCYGVTSLIIEIIRNAK